jgi:hypothetical protein
VYEKGTLILIEYFLKLLFNQFGKYLILEYLKAPAKLLNSTAGWDQVPMPNDDGEYYMRLLLDT